MVEKLQERIRRHGELLERTRALPQGGFKRPLVNYLALRQPSGKFSGVASGAELREGLEQSVRSMEQSIHAFETERTGGVTLKGDVDLRKSIRSYGVALKLHQGMLDLALKHRLLEL